ncbi:alpha/beta hydrolase family protein [Natranaerovirga hydrolytica]|uniref:Alpha/beta hydrolase family protein n=1 Tax=Natranaerovirga hydrolytica TaxID=680378 RepID=A0A4R1MB36_9FIRM|nr:alpha/beta hydrolase [Natranaerovirga hydrolytica]TCK89137.1 alpha/beta hydrolase family protein [Natranaerovirga hydrolytica]
MNNKINIYYKYINWKIALLAFLIFVAFMIFVLPSVSENTKQMTGILESPDTLFYYTAEELYTMAEMYEEDGRAYYIKTRLTFDIIWPAVYLFFLVSAIAIVYRHFNSSSNWRYTIVLPFIGVIFDCLENIGASIVMYRFPQRTPVLAELTPVFTMLKWIFIYASFAAIILGGSILILSQLIQLSSRKKRIFFGSIAGVIVLIAGGFFWYVSDYYEATSEALVSLQSDKDVTVYQDDNLLVFEPTNRDHNGSNNEVGFIFYPGGKVEHQAYAPIIKEIARQGYLSIIIEMPFKLAVLAPNRAQEAISTFPEITNWVIGGHSLGGSMAARHVNTNQGAFDGLVFWASYGDIDLTEANLTVLSIYGTQDGLISMDKIDNTSDLLSEETIFKEIAGGNHAYFGMYGEQKGDLAATISIDKQHRIIIDTTVEFLHSFRDQ